MTGGADQLKNDLIEKCVQRIQDRLEPKRAEIVERFLRHFYANVPPDDLIGDSPDNLYGAALSMFGFVQKRDADAAKVRVYNPRLEEHGWKSSHTVVEIVNGVNSSPPMTTVSLGAALAMGAPSSWKRRSPVSSRSATA